MNGIAYGNEVVVGSGLVSSFSNPILVSNNGTNVTISSTILADGGCPITERGICWSVSSNPSLVLGTGNLNPFYASNGIGIGTYTAEMLNLVPNTTYYIRSYAKTSTGTYFSNQITCTTNAVTGLALGQTYAGGIIFYLDSTVQHGLVCAPQDQGHYPWGCDGNYIGTTSSAMGSGAQNTAIIISSCSQSNIAAKICDELVLNAYTDWYLPSFSELNIMYQNLVLNGIGGFSTFAYWSSTEFDALRAWMQFFINGNQAWDRKSVPHAYVVRAVRSF